MEVELIEGFDNYEQPPNENPKTEWNVENNNLFSSKWTTEDVRDSLFIKLDDGSHMLSLIDSGLPANITKNIKNPNIFYIFLNFYPKNISGTMMNIYTNNHPLISGEHSLLRMMFENGLFKFKIHEQYTKTFFDPVHLEDDKNEVEICYKFDLQNSTIKIRINEEIFEDTLNLGVNDGIYRIPESSLTYLNLRSGSAQNLDEGGCSYDNIYIETSNDNNDTPEFKGNIQVKPITFTPGNKKRWIENKTRRIRRTAAEVAQYNSSSNSWDFFTTIGTLRDDGTNLNKQAFRFINLPLKKTTIVEKAYLWIRLLDNAGESEARVDVYSSSDFGRLPLDNEDNLVENISNRRIDIEEEWIKIDIANLMRSSINHSNWLSGDGDPIVQNNIVIQLKTVESFILRNYIFQNSTNFKSFNRNNIPYLEIFYRDENGEADLGNTNNTSIISGGLNGFYEFESQTNIKEALGLSLQYYVNHNRNFLNNGFELRSTLSKEGNEISVESDLVLGGRSLENNIKIEPGSFLQDLSQIKNKIEMIKK